MIILEPKVYETLGQGIKYAVDAVKPTLGPLGKNIAYDPKLDVPYIVNSGREIIKRINFMDDKALMVGVDTIKMAMEDAFWKAGDGSVATAVLIESMWNEGQKNIAAGADPMAIMRGIRKAGEVAVSAADGFADKVEKDDIRGLAKCAAAGRDDIADIVCDVYDHIGDNGYVTVEDSQGAETHISYFKGVKWEKGFEGHWEIESVTQDEPYVLVINKVVSTYEELVPVLKEAKEKGVSLLIIAREFKDPVPASIQYVRNSAGLDVMLVTAPGYGEVRDKNMKNFAAMFGGSLYDEMTTQFNEYKLADCGRVGKAVINKKNTTLQGIPNPDDPTVVARRNELYADLEHIKDEDERYRIEQMLTPLAGETAEILVGGVMEMEMFERKYLCENSIHNTYNAIKHGMLPGGGKGHILLIPKTEEFVKTLTGDERVGGMIVLKALRSIAEQLSDNAGYDGKRNADAMIESTDKYQGFNVLTGKTEDLRKAGVLDSVEFVKYSLETAVSSVSTVLSVAACVVAKDPSEEDDF